MKVMMVVSMLHNLAPARLLHGLPLGVFKFEEVGDSTCARMKSTYKPSIDYSYMSIFLVMFLILPHQSVQISKTSVRSALNKLHPT